MAGEVSPYLVQFVVGTLMWASGRTRQCREPEDYRPSPILFRGPAWLRLLCGRLFADGQLELGETVLQLTGVAILLLVPVFLVFRVGYLHRALVWVGILLLGIILAALIRSVHAVWRWLRR